MDRRGLFITLEGIEGAGKTTMLGVVENWFKQRGRETIRVREPGGTPLGERIRTLFLEAKKDEISKVEDDVMLLVAAKRALWRDVIRPNLNAGKIVIADRWTDTLFAYQGGGFGGSIEHINNVLKAHQIEHMPSLTLYLDVPPEVGLGRVRGRADNNALDGYSVKFFERVRTVFQQRVVSPEHFVRMISIDANRNQPDVEHAVLHALHTRARILMEEPIPA